jgi:hypothetical protein
VFGQARGSLVPRVRTNADGKYLIIGNEGNELIVTDGKGVYKTGEQIITSKVTTSVGEAARTEVRNITFNDESAVAPVLELQQAYPNADIYLNGQLTIDFPEEVKIPIEPNQMVTASVMGNSVRFSYCELEKAIAHSSKLKTLDDRIALIDRRLGVSRDSIDYANNKLWTNYLPSSTTFGDSVLDIINPFAWIKNLAGGGEMQRDRLAIADLEVKAATLEAARAELERQREEEKVLLGEKVLRLLLDYEAVSRKYELVESQLKTYNQQQEILRIRYRLGEGETAEFLESQVKGEGLRGQLVELESLLAEKVRELVQVTGWEKTKENPSN